MSIKWCVIGAGGIADRRTIPAILQNKSSELVAVMDRVPAVAESVGKKYGVPYFTTEEEMLSSVDCDAVYIGTPVMCHYEQALTALRFGKHVFVEKPVALDGKTSSNAASYVSIVSDVSGKTYWGTGIDSDIGASSVKALVSAVNVMLASEQ